MDVLWFTEHFHINVLHDCKHYSSILKVQKLRPRDIESLIVTQVEEPQFVSTSSYSYFQSMEPLKKGQGEVTFWL